MKAMILAAGRGTRMRALTDTLPKPLLTVRDTPLLDRLIGQLATAGFTDIVINVAYLGGKIREHLGTGAHLSVTIRYSDEGPAGLETGGGIRRALPLLGHEPFLVVNGDIYTDYDFSRLPAAPAALAHLVLADNPDHHPQGDFGLCDGRVTDSAPRLTFTGIGVYRATLFAEMTADRFPLAPLLRRAILQGLVTGEHHRGLWTDVGTPERLAALNAAGMDR
ncbi:N-acetylmuramate alpha-1-phosphate uridylyltransferase MurU [Acidiferrobacter sp.]|uniref:N-acetylmuramate alpha-1-phosphate uridylyltransferase MurU n=1 Tax=Acidiferrobacter sp. TaxID=1872107 RepID=UPI00261FA106|nr:nucleotidyltransferase family protein [Acidiferrobacter sp.]